MLFTPPKKTDDAVKAEREIRDDKPEASTEVERPVSARRLTPSSSLRAQTGKTSALRPSKASASTPAGGGEGTTPDGSLPRAVSLAGRSEGKKSSANPLTEAKLVAAQAGVKPGAVAKPDEAAAMSEAEAVKSKDIIAESAEHAAIDKPASVKPNVAGATLKAQALESKTITAEPAAISKPDALAKPDVAAAMLEAEAVKSKTSIAEPDSIGKPDVDAVIAKAGAAEQQAVAGASDSAVATAEAVAVKPEAPSGASPSSPERTPRRPSGLLSDLLSPPSKASSGLSSSFRPEPMADSGKAIPPAQAATDPFAAAVVVSPAGSAVADAASLPEMALNAPNTVADTAPNALADTVTTVGPGIVSDTVADTASGIAPDSAAMSDTVVTPTVTSTAASTNGPTATAATAGAAASPEFAGVPTVVSQPEKNFAVGFPPNPDDEPLPTMPGGGPLLGAGPMFSGSAAEALLGTTLPLGPAGEQYSANGFSAAGQHSEGASAAPRRGSANIFTALGKSVLFTRMGKVLRAVFLGDENEQRPDQSTFAALRNFLRMGKKQGDQGQAQAQGQESPSLFAAMDAPLHGLTPDDINFASEVDAALARRPRFGVRALSVCVACMFLILTVWAAFADVDEVTHGEGQVVGSQRTQAIQNLEGGILRSVMVREGQIVEKGAVVAQLDNEMAESAYRDAVSKAMENSLAILRLEAELKGGQPTFPEDIRAWAVSLIGHKATDAIMARAQQIVKDQINTWQARDEQIGAEISVLQAQFEQRRREMEEQTARKTQLDRSLDLAIQQRDTAYALLQRNNFSRMEYLGLQQKVVETQGQIDMLAAGIPKARAAAEEARQRIASRRGEQGSAINEEINKRRLELSSLRETLSAGSDRVTRTELRTPVRGTIKQIYVNTLGGVVKPGESIMDIVPLDDTLLVEAKVVPKDVAFLHPGQSVMVKVSAYDFSIYGGLEGKVESISADTIENKKGEYHFLVKVRTQKTTLTYQTETLPIIPGMVVTADILIGKKTVLDYILKPILKAKQNALRER